MAEKQDVVVSGRVIDTYTLPYGSFHVKSTKKNRHPSQISPKLGSYIVCTKSSNHNNF